MSNSCKKCKKKADNDLPLFKCDGCSSHWCKGCGDLSASEVKVMQFKGTRTMKFFCLDCVNYSAIKLLEVIIEDKVDIISSKEKVIEQLERDLVDRQRQIEHYQSVKEESLQHRETYVTVANAGVSSKPDKNLPCIMIKPKVQQTGPRTRSELQSKIKPSKISAGIRMLKEVKNGGIVLKCDSGQSTERVKAEAQSVLGHDYTITETKLLTPSITVANIPKEMKSEEVMEAIRSQNDFLTDTDELKLKVLRDARSGRSLYAVIQCNGSCF